MIKPIVLIILDGWGIGKNDKGNAIKKATLPTIEKLDEYYPKIALQASGISVGLPWGEVGNSEVGHMTLGAGKVIYQNMPRITLAIQSGEFFQNEALQKAMQNAKKENSSLHLMGLLGDGGVHAHTDHLYALLEMAKKEKVEKVFVHIFTDGRDSEMTAGAKKVAELIERMKKLEIGKIATIGGRYFAMDRNNNWDRIEKAYQTMTEETGNKITDPVEYLEENYKKKVFDEYIEPAWIENNGEFSGKIKDKDSVIFFNFREDRARQITKAFTLPSFSKFKRDYLKNIIFVTMVKYENSLPVEVAFPPTKTIHCLGNLISKRGLHQLRIAETEKFAHVTYFFNVGNEESYPKEDRIIVNSVSVDTFDKAPEMSAQEVTDKALAAIDKNRYSFILINYANPDIVAHTGNEKATILAVEKVDNCLSQIIPRVLEKGGTLIITADHGNAEELINVRTGQIDTEHSSNPVPLWYITPENHREKPLPKKDAEIKVEGFLSDIAPTILDLMKIEKPQEMTGESLLPTLK